MLLDAQSNMRQNYINGGPGVLVSGLVWLMAVVLTAFTGFTYGMIAFFIGGMMIHPVSVVISRQMKTEIASPDKGLTTLSLLTLPFLFGGLYLAYLVSTHSPALFYPIMAVTIGLRYFMFQRVYGLKEFVILGAVLCGIGGLSLLQTPAVIILVPLAVGLVEIAFGVLLMRKARGYNS